MQEYINFFQQHLLLSSAFVIILVLMIANEIRYRLSGVAKLSARQVTQAFNRETAVLIDVRTRNDYQRSHILGAMNIVESELLTDLKRL